MRQHPERLRQPPLREGVGRIALVIDREGALEARVLQVGIELRHVLRQHHPLVDDRPAGQRAHVEVRHARRRRRLLDPPPDHVQLALEGLLVGALGVRDDDLLDLGPGRVGLGAQHLDIHRHMPPAIDVIAHPQHFGFDDGPAGLLRAEIGARQEHLPDRDRLVARRVAGALDLVLEERVRDLDMDARAVAGLAVGIDRAAVPDRLQRVDAVLHHLAAPRAVDRHDKAHAAGRMFVRLGIEPVLGQPGALRLLGRNPGVIIGGHRVASFTCGLRA